MLVYLFDGSHLAENEAIGIKAFSKKMKNFIGKAVSMDESKESDNIFTLRSLL